MAPSYNWEKSTKQKLWGGDGGTEWNYQPNGPITEIAVHHGSLIDSISFRSIDGGNKTHGSDVYGGSGGAIEEPFKIQWPNDYLVSISGTYGTYDGKKVIRSLRFKTKRGKESKSYGGTGGEKFEYFMENEIIIGFYGRSGDVLDAIGTYVKPYADFYCPSNHAQILREERDVIPAHFLFKVKSYSLIPNKQGIKYDSYYFVTSGYKWKLILYPYGDDTSLGKDHISLYLELLETSIASRTNDWSVCVDLKFFVHNKKTQKYLTIQDAKGAVMTFNKKSTKQGFSQLLSLDTFKNSGNGYLVNDCCTFGVEVFVVKPSSRCPEQTLTVVKDSVSPQSHVVIERPNGNVYCWQIAKFKELGANSIINSFDFGGLKWEFRIDPKGDNVENVRGKYLSLYVLPKAGRRKVDMTATLAVIHHNGGEDVEKTVSHEFNGQTNKPWGWGYQDFMLLSDIYEPSKGYLKDGNLIVQVKFDKITISS